MAPTGEFAPTSWRLLVPKDRLDLQVPRVPLVLRASGACKDLPDPRASKECRVRAACLVCPEPKALPAPKGTTAWMARKGPLDHAAFKAKLDPPVSRELPEPKVPKAFKGPSALKGSKAIRVPWVPRVRWVQLVHRASRV